MKSTYQSVAAKGPVNLTKHGMASELKASQKQMTWNFRKSQKLNFINQFIIGEMDKKKEALHIIDNIHWAKDLWFSP